LRFISTDILDWTLSQFRLPIPCGFRALPKSALKRDIMLKVEFKDGPSALVRFHDPLYYRHKDIECQTKFRSFIHSEGIPVARLHTTADGALYLDVEIKDEIWPVTVEEWVAGEPPSAVSPALVALMGRTLGRMHLAAPESGVSFSHGTRMSLFAEGDMYYANAVNLWNVLDEAGLVTGAKSTLFDSWRRAREELRGMWDSLPAGPVHGDFAEYNLLLDETEDIAAVIDFNRAGDERFVNELVHACLSLPSSGQDDHDRDNFHRFVSAYEGVRPLSQEEKRAIPLLITVVRPFRTREISPLLKALRSGDEKSALAGLRRLSRLADPSALVIQGIGATTQR